MHRTYLLLVAALVKVGTGLLLLVLPSVLLGLLIGIEEASREALLIARIAGAALFGLGVASGAGRSNKQGSAQLGLIIGVLIYDASATVVLAYAGLALNLVGIALWPAVVLHSAIAVWCLLCLARKPRGE